MLRWFKAAFASSGASLGELASAHLWERLGGAQDGATPHLSPSPMPQLTDSAVRAAKPTPGKTTRLYDTGVAYTSSSLQSAAKPSA